MASKLCVAMAKVCAACSCSSRSEEPSNPATSPGFVQLLRNGEVVYEGCIGRQAWCGLRLDCGA